MPINRKELVARHRIQLTQPDAQSPLSVGNGEFAFTADVTGLQTFPEFHMQGMQLGTQSQWAWHTMPNPHNYQFEDSLTPYPTSLGPVTYPDLYYFAPPDQPPVPGQDAGKWLHSNPQRLDLGRIGLVLHRQDSDAPSTSITDLTETHQTLDLWQGLLESQFCFDGSRTHVRTVCHPVLDLLAVRIESPLLADGRLAVQLAFPYASDQWNISADWTKPERHHTDYTLTSTHCTFARTLDNDHYYTALTWTAGAELTPCSTHHYHLTSIGSTTLEFIIAFAPSSLSKPLPTFSQTQSSAATHWEQFWTQGAAIDFSASTDPRAPELERRVVLSQYLTAINCAGTLPPQETGLVCNSWGGKFHLEMHWWHAAHFMLWKRSHLFERSMPWYQRILPQAQATAQRQGYLGARWPKQIGPDAQESPSTIGPFLIWQQPHPIYYAELLWRVHPEPSTLERYQELVFETAAFMASYPIFDDERYNLAPPLIPAQESYWKERTSVLNPTFELAYWYWGLETAQIWRERLALPRDPHWEHVKNNLAKPTILDGIYTAIENPPYTVHNDHPSMLGALGFVPQVPLIDPKIMRQTLHAVIQDWNWQSTWGWDYPLMAMSAARLGEPERAINALLIDTQKNTYLTNGHNLQIPTMLPLYLPGNGGLLMAIAMMAAGWDGAPDQPAPGFPSDGTWNVQAEGLSPMP